MKGYEKYQRAYFMAPVCTYDWVKKDYIDKAPIWCSVDLYTFFTFSIESRAKNPSAAPASTITEFREISKSDVKYL